MLHMLLASLWARHRRNWPSGCFAGMLTYLCDSLFAQSGQLAKTKKEKRGRLAFADRDGEGG